MSAGLGVVVPAYRPVVDRLVAYLGRLDATLSPATLRVELDDPGGTVAPALGERALPASAEVAVVRHRRGKGAAVTAGFEALSTPVRAFVDADGATPATSVGDVVAAVRDGDADVAVGSRRHPEADVADHQTVVRRFLGDGFAWLARRLLDAELFDYQCGAKATSAECWRAVRDHLHEPGFAWDIELVAVAAALGRRVAEVPVTWQDKPGSTVDPVDDGVGMLRGLVAARHRARLLDDDSMHGLVDGGRDPEPALVDRLTFANAGAGGLGPSLRRLARSNLVRLGGIAVQLGTFSAVYRLPAVTLRVADVDVWFVVAKTVGIGAGMVVNYVAESLFTWDVAGE